MRGELFSIVVSDCFDAVSERQKHACAGLHDRVAFLSGSLASLVYLEVRSTCDMTTPLRLAPIIVSASQVSDAAFCGDNRRPLIDIDAVRNEPAPPAFAPVVFFAAVTQVKIAACPVFLVFPDMLIDALVTDKGDTILRQTPADPDPATPLLLRQFSSISSTKSGVILRGLSEASSRLCEAFCVRLLEAIAARAGVANKLAARSSTDRRQFAAQCGLASGRFARARKSGSVVRRSDGDSLRAFFLREMCCRHARIVSI